MLAHDKDSLLRLMRPEILAMPGYDAAEPWDAIAEKLGVPKDKVAKLDANENLWGTSPKVRAALGQERFYNLYPDTQQRRARAALAEYAGVTPEHIVASAGSDALIDLVTRVFCAPGDGVLVCPPVFGM